MTATHYLVKTGADTYFGRLPGEAGATTQCPRRFAYVHDQAEAHDIAEMLSRTWAGRLVLAEVIPC